MEVFMNEQKKSSDANGTPRMMTMIKRIICIVGVILLVSLYIATLILAVLGKPGTEKLFLASAFCTILVPIFLYVIVWLQGVLKK